MASATLMKRFAKRVSKMGSTPLLEGFWPSLTLNSVDMIVQEKGEFDAGAAFIFRQSIVVG